jgi:hypothetical protein
MSIPRKHLHALDVVSVLLFSLLANYLLTLKIDFKASLDYVATTKLVLLSISAIIFYTTMVRLNELARYSQAEYDAETSMADQARRSVDERFRDYCRPEGARIMLSLAMAVVCGLMFFLVEPFAQLF